MAGIGGARIWKDVKGQSTLGNEDFVESLIEIVEGYRDAREIPRIQRYVSRPELEELLNDKIQRDGRQMKVKVKEAVEKHGYTQKEVADHIGIHYSVVSTMVNS